MENDLSQELMSDLANMEDNAELVEESFEAGKKARVTAIYYKTLRNEGVPRDLACALTEKNFCPNIYLKQIETDDGE